MKNAGLRTHSTKNIFTRPTKGQLIGLISTWTVSVLLLLLAMTDMFTEPLLQRRYLMLLFLLMTATIAVGYAARNYLNKLP